MRITVRDALVGDAKGFAEIHVKSWQVAYVDYMNGEFLQSMSISKQEEQWNTILESPSEGKYVVAEDSRGVKAFAVYGPARDHDIEGDIAELVALNVHPEHWRNRFGSTLLLDVMKKAKALGYIEIYLWVIEGNEVAIELYTKHGFTHSGIRKVNTKHSGNPIDELRYSASLV